MSWDLLNDDVRELIFKMKTSMEIENKFKREHSKKMAEAFDLIKVRGKRMEIQCALNIPGLDDRYCKVFLDYVFKDYLIKYGETDDYERWQWFPITERQQFYPLFMHIH